MTSTPDTNERPGWDRLIETGDDDFGVVDHEPDHGDDAPAPTALTLVAASWADLVAVGVLATACLGGVAAAGNPLTVAALPWAIGVGFAWWVMAATLCLRVRRGTPGMLVAGVVFGDAVVGSRIVRTLLAATAAAVGTGLMESSPTEPAQTRGAAC